MTMQAALRSCLAILLAFGAGLLLCSCGNSGRGLIPEANAGPLRADFESVARAAGAGDGSCAATEAALGKTERDFLALPASIDRGLRSRLQEGIANLHRRALAMCVQPAPTATSTTSTATTPSTAPTQTTPTTTSTNTTPTVTAPPSEGGGTPAGEGEEGHGQAKGNGEGNGKGNGNGPGSEQGPGKGKGGDEGGPEAGGEANSGGARAGGASPGAGR